MSNDQVRKVLLQKVLITQNLIERCIQLYMSETETVEYLLHHAKIELDFTKHVWQRLEEGSPKFFKAYHLRLALKAQIRRFNELLERQIELMHHTGRGVTSSSNGSQMHSRMNDVLMESESEGGFMNNLVEAPNAIGEAFVSAFTSTSDPMETSSIGQIPHNLSITDLTAYFSNNTDILENYSLLSFLDTQVNLDPHITSEQQDWTPYRKG